MDRNKVYHIKYAKDIEIYIGEEYSEVLNAFDKHFKDKNIEYRKYISLLNLLSEDGLELLDVRSYVGMVINNCEIVAYLKNEMYYESEFETLLNNDETWRDYLVGLEARDIYNIYVKAYNHWLMLKEREEALEKLDEDFGDASFESLFEGGGLTFFEGDKWFKASDAAELNKEAMSNIKNKADYLKLELDGIFNMFKPDEAENANATLRTTLITKDEYAAIFTFKNGDFGYVLAFSEDNTIDELKDMSCAYLSEDAFNDFVANLKAKLEYEGKIDTGITYRGQVSDIKYMGDLSFNTIDRNASLDWEETVKSIEEDWKRVNSRGKEKGTVLAIKGLNLASKGADKLKKGIEVLKGKLAE